MKNQKPKTKNQISWFPVALLSLIVSISSCKILPENLPLEAETVSQRSTQGIERDLEYLTYGLAMAHHELYDTLAGGQLYNPISNIMFRKASRGVTDYYAVTYKHILNEAELLGIELDSMMNAHIRAEYNITDTSNLVRLILANNYHNGTNYSFHIVFPYLDNLTGLTPDSITELIPMTETKFAMLNSKRPIWTWSYEDKTYPLDGFGVSGIGSWEELGDVIPSGLPKPVAVSAFTPLDIDLYFDVLTDEEVIIDCNVIEIYCQECPYVNTDAPVSDVSGAFAGDDEIYIVLLEGGSKGGCYLLDEAESTSDAWNAEGTYAIIRSLPQFDYYYATPGAVNRDLLKMNNTLHSGVSNRWGKYLTLCNPEPTFKVVGEGFDAEDFKYHLARGGIYELKLPGITNDPIYFSFPFAQYFWYITGPDMRIHYTLNWDGTSFCSSPDILGVSHNQYTSLNLFLDNNLLDPGNNRYIATTDYFEITEFWEDCWIYVGVSPDNYLNEEHVVAFEATTDPPIPITPANLGDELGSLITKESVLPSDVDGGGSTTAFEISRYLSELAEIEYGQHYIVYVQAAFENGEIVHQYIELIYGDTEHPANTVKTFFRGNLVDMEIRVYETL
ncbi:MAG: hypothetical protein R2767_04275 [Chitinophagales bacterium]